MSRKNDNLRRSGHPGEDIRLYDDNSDFKCWISHEDAFLLAERSQVEELYETRPNGKRNLLGVKIVAEMSKTDRRSPCHITRRETEINAGVYEDWIKPGRIKAVETKIKLWPQIGDTKAVRVGPRV